MIDKLKENWKIIAGVVVASLLIWWACCGGTEVEVAPVEEVPVEVVPEVEPAPAEE